MISEESFVDFSCPYCGDPVSFPRESAGSLQACPNCTESLIVPADGSSVGLKIPLPLTTARLTLRRFDPADWKDLLEMLSNEDIFQFVEGAPLEEDEVLRWLERDAVLKLTTPDQVFHVGIELNEASKLIGYASLQFTDVQRLQASVQAFLNCNYQSKGYAREAFAALLEFCFTQLHIHRLSASCDTRHARALKLLEAVGLRREGEFLENRLLKGQWASTAYYAILQQEYTGRSQAGS